MIIDKKHYEQIISFWFSKEVRPFWFAKDDDFDQKIRIKFLEIHEQALYNFSEKEINNVEERLALIILFDQFSRNMFRGSAMAFSADQKALELSKYGIEKKLDEELFEKEQLSFFYMPLMHSENLQDQEIAVNLFHKIGEASHEFAIKHRDIIKYFSRFPQRNKALGRESTAEEIEFLKEFNLF